MFKTQSKKLTFSDQLSNAIKAKTKSTSKSMRSKEEKKIVPPTPPSSESESNSEEDDSEGEVKESKEQKQDPLIKLPSNGGKFEEHKHKHDALVKLENAVKSRTKLSDLSDEDKFLRHKEQMKEWREQHQDYNKTYRQKYYAENRDKILEKRRIKRQEEKKVLEEFKAYKASQLK